MPSSGRKPKNRNGAQNDVNTDYEFDEFQILFMEAYCRTFNASQAAIEAGYHKQEGWRLLRNPHIVQSLYERLKAEKMAPPEVINKVGQIARADLKHYMRVERTFTEKETTDPKTGEVTKHRVMHKKVVVDLVHAMENDETYPLKSIEYYRSGEVKKITIEDRLEAIRLMGSAFGLFGVSKAGDDEGRSWIERARDRGYEVKTVIDAMFEIAKEHGMAPPKELIEGSFRETMNPETGKTEIEIGDLSEEEEINATISEETSGD